MKGCEQGPGLEWGYKQGEGASGRGALVTAYSSLARNKQREGQKQPQRSRDSGPPTLFQP